MKKMPQLTKEVRAELPPAVQEYVGYLEGLIRSASVLDVDVETASREELVGLIFSLLERQLVTEERLRELEKLVDRGRGQGRGRPGGKKKGSGLSAEPGTEKDPLGEGSGEKQPPDWAKANKPVEPKKERKKREKGYSRKLDKPTHRVEHAYEECPECETALGDGRVYYRRQIVSLPRVRVRVTEHVILERKCESCGQKWRPEPDFSKLVVGQQRIGISIQSEVAILRQVCRMPYETIQSYLKQCRGLHLSRGELVNLARGVAERGREEYERLREEIWHSPVVNADETGWRENGQNGYLWSFSTPGVRYFLYRKSRAGSVVREVLGDEFDGILGSDFYGAYNVHDGFHQRCWAHLLRAIRELKQRHPNDEALKTWADGVRDIYDRARAYPGPDPSLPQDKWQVARVKAQRRFEQELWVLCEPYVRTEAVMAVLCERIERFLPELFVFVADPRVSSDNNAAERALRPEVVSRKISGGTRSGQGSDTKSILATLFGTWRLQGLDLYESCRQILIKGSLANPPALPARGPPT